MILGIDASNIRAGGGLTHLKAILSELENIQTQFDKVVVWSSQKTLERLPDSNLLHKKSHPLLNKTNLHATTWQFTQLKKSFNREKCDILFVPGSTLVSTKLRYVTMSQNMLPFEDEENKFFNLKARLRYKLLYIFQSRTFKKAKGVIFLTNYAKKFIEDKINLDTSTTIIPHGIDNSFKNPPIEQKNTSFYSFDQPFEFLYVSNIIIYKHQWNVIKAVSKCRDQGYPFEVTFVGGISSHEHLVEEALQECDEHKHAFKFVGKIPHNEIISYQNKADAFLYASSCENMPITLIESIIAGLPIASSNSGPMPEVLEDNAYFFNPRSVHQMEKALIELFENPNERLGRSENAYRKFADYSWHDCAQATFDYLYHIAQTLNH